MATRYAKLKESGQIEYAPNPIEIDGKKVANPKPERLIALGYKKIITSTPSMPPEGYYMTPSWEETESEIRQVWSPVELPFDVGN